ncbi:EF-hand domain-containing protein [Actinokineospora auranticolor]|uniref:Ca2+-binding EF-hand superfamily protein n=1 Tax=Actinokineospora auranticolor TaxID=155976 RepID=A0A2S6GFR8_9PSEU|nr:EF-hand domain-containing protein [Actinokineospora auranticolor]PPK64062.1 Ca2+-binding EF-hand superfamily protein [Actinokineospora auranticolor]
MTASIQDSRLKRRFELWDSNGDGQIDQSDYEAEARRILQGFGEQESSPKGRALLSAYAQMWDKLQAKADTDHSGTVSMQEFIRVSEQEIVDAGNPGFNQNLRPAIEAIVDIADTDGDGEVNAAEFTRWMRAAGVDESTAKASFNQLDSNHSGALSVDEIVDAVRDYHQGKHDIPLLGG